MIHFSGELTQKNVIGYDDEAFKTHTKKSFKIDIGKLNVCRDLVLVLCVHHHNSSLKCHNKGVCIMFEQRDT